MSSSFIQFLRPCLLFITIGVAPQKGYGQCNPPWQLPAHDCSIAEVTCLQNACYTLTNIPNYGPFGWCGPNTSIGNPQYFKFIASGETVTIHISVDDCDMGQGIQAGLLSACPWGLADVLDCNPAEFPGGVIQLSSQVIPGEMYWLLVDGFSNAICDYSIIYVEGVVEVEIPGELNVAETFVVPAELCRGYDDAHFITGPQLEEAHGYYWIFSWSPTDTITSTLHELSYDIPIDIPEGEYSFCVRAFSGCDTTNAVCQTFTVLASDTIDNQSVLCPEVFPFTWGNTTISGPGTYQETFVDANGCITDTVWVVESYPEQPVDTTTIVTCDPDYMYVPGIYELEFPNANIYGCDSFHVLDIQAWYISAFVEVSCEEELHLQTYILELGNSNDDLTYAWYTCGFEVLLSDEPDFYPDSAGCYCVVTAGINCQDTVCITITEETCVHECGLVDEFHCEGAEVVFTLPWPVSAEADIIWRIYEYGELIETIEGVTTFTRSFDPDLYDVAVTVIDSGMTMACQEEFVVTTTPFAGICCDTLICDSCAFITIQSNDVVNLSLVDQFGFPYHLVGIFGGAAIEICPPAFPYTLTLLEVSGTYSGCNGEVSLPDQLTISRAPDIVIQQTGESLCIEAENPLSVKWHACTDTITLADELCFQPTMNGCYCVEITDINLCVISDCYEFLSIHTLDAIKEGFAFFPNPSADVFSLKIPDHVNLPVEWILYDGTGKAVGTGSIEGYESQFSWPEKAIPGKYEMLLKDGQNAFRLGLMRLGNK